MSTHCTLDFEDSKEIISHDTPAHDVVSPYQQAWLQKVLQFRTYHLAKYSLKSAHQL